MTRISMALVHHPVVNRQGEIYTTSITNLDVHDLARAGRTYGLGAFYVVTPISAQQTMARAIVGHWDSPEGRAQNTDRAEAMSRAHVVASLEEAIAAEQAATSSAVRTVATSAKPEGALSYAQLRSDLHGVQTSAPGARSTMLVFGTGHGLAPSIMAAVDDVLQPIASVDGYNHLSVRSAVSIILDRLLGTER